MQVVAGYGCYVISLIVSFAILNRLFSLNNFYYI